MSEPDELIVSRHVAPEHGNLQTYVIGFVASLICTIAAYLLATHHLLTRHWLVAAVVILALTQFAVQLLFFLGLGREAKPRWKLGVFLFMLLVVSILVFGSLWIMGNLNYRMTPQQMLRYMNSQAGL